MNITKINQTFKGVKVKVTVKHTKSFIKTRLDTLKKF